MSTTEKKRIMSRYAELQRELTHMFNTYRTENEWRVGGDSRLEVIGYEMSRLLEEISRPG